MIISGFQHFSQSLILLLFSFILIFFIFQCEPNLDICILFHWDDFIFILSFWMCCAMLCRAGLLCVYVLFVKNQNFIVFSEIILFCSSQWRAKAMHSFVCLIILGIFLLLFSSLCLGMDQKYLLVWWISYFIYLFVTVHRCGHGSRCISWKIHDTVHFVEGFYFFSSCILLFLLLFS